MKKILLATTALLASATFAAAEVTVSGTAEMGIIGGDGNIATNGGSGDLQFWHSIEVKFGMTGATDSGLEFGATIELDEASASNGLNHYGATSFIKGAFGTLTMGDTDGAYDWALTEIGIGSAIADDHTTHVGYNGNSGLDGSTNGASGDGLIARYEYAFDAFAVAVSAEIDSDDDVVVGGVVTSTSDDVFGLGFKYNADLGGTTIALGLGYQTNGKRDYIAVSAAAGFGGGFKGVLNYADLDGLVAGDRDKYMGIGLGYTMDALTASINYGQYDVLGAGDDIDGFGVAVNYDLGGGAVVQFGYGSDTDGGTLGDQEQYSLGVALSF